jgi:hypothetical protein
MIFFALRSRRECVSMFFHSNTFIGSNESEVFACRAAMFQLLDMVFKFPTVKLPDAAVTKCVNGTCDGKLMSTTEFHCVNGACESKVLNLTISIYPLDFPPFAQMIVRANAAAVLCWVVENRHCRRRRCCRQG